MKIEKRQQDDVTVVVIEGVIKLGESARLFSGYLKELFDGDTGGVLIDMTEIDYVDSTGLGELVGYLQRFEDQGRRLALLRPQSRIRNLLKVTQLDKVFQIFTDEQEAVEALKG
ncbi:MAG: STAS domain-containing protein [Acidobacteria bacterium]|nr:STAS domain-containing protein [Acidobacteriota bacterium]